MARCLGKLDLAERVLAKFESRLDEDLAELEQALRAEDSELIASIAHRLRGASANAAAHGIRERATTIEQLARQRRLPEMPAQMQGLRREWARFTETRPRLVPAPGSTA